jgi:hypothetical protein
MPKTPLGCARPTGNIVGGEPIDEDDQPNQGQPLEKETKMTAKVGAKAPDFEAPTYYRGEFSQVKLSNYLGKWVLLCFYPGDFTFV